MGVVVLVGRTREERRRALGAAVGLDGFQRPDFLYLTATRRKADLLRAAWWDQPDKPPTFLPDVRPWGRFRDELAERWGDGGALLSPVARDLLAGSVFRSLRPSLRVWGGLLDGPEARRALAEFAESWALGFTGSSPPPLGDEPFALRFPGEPEQDFGPLFASTRAVGPALRHDAWRWLRAWREALTRSPRWTDRAGVARGLLRALREPPAPMLGTFARWRGVIVDDLLWLAPLELALLRELLAAFRAASPEGTVYLCLEAPVGGSEDAARRWLESGASDGLGLGITAPLRASFLGELSRGGRLRVADAAPGVADLSDLLAQDEVLDGTAAVGGVRVRTYPSEHGEVRAIARTLKAELLAGRPPDQLHVSFPELDRYAPVVRDVFAAYGIPFVVEKGEELLHAPPASAARQLLRLAVVPADPGSLRSLLASGWVNAWFPLEVDRAEPLLERLREPLAGRFAPVRAATVERIEELVAVAPNMERLFAAVLIAGAQGRPADWLEAIAAWHLREARDHLARAGGDPGHVSRIEARLIGELAGVLVDVLALERLLDALAPLQAAPTPREAAERLLELLHTVGIRAREAHPALDPVRARATEANQAAIEALRELVTEVAASLEGVALAAPGAALRPVEVLRDALEDAVRRTTYRSGGPQHGVQVVGLRDLHGADVPWLWVGGLSDGSFPRGPLPGFLLPSTDPPLVPAVDRAEEDRAIFASLLRNAGRGEGARTLILSWPHSDGGRELVPSPLLADLRALRVRGGDELGAFWSERQRAEEAALPPLLSRDELLNRPDLCAALPEDAEPPVLSGADRAAMAAWDEVVDARTDDTGFGAWDGVLAMDRPYRPLVLEWLRELLGTRQGRDGRIVLSLPTTGLEAWAKCPIRYFFERVLGVEEPRPFALEPGKDESGTLTHEVLERFLGERIAARKAGALPNAALWNLSLPERDAAKASLRALTLEVVQERLGHRRGPWLDRVVEELLAGLSPKDHPYLGTLARFLDEEGRGPLFDAEPTYVEHRFKDLSPANAAWRVQPKDERDPRFRAGTGDLDLRLRGSIDRVDLPPSRGGRRLGDGGLRAVVYDYKTGRTPHMDAVDVGLQLQPAVYPMAIDVPWWASGLVSGYWELGEEPGRQRRRLAVSTRLWRYLNEQDGRLALPFSFKKTSLPTTMWAWRAWLMRADYYGQLLGSGVFPPTLRDPKVAGCESCPFRRGCRTEPVRTERIIHPPDPGPGRVAPVFWPASFSVLDGLEAMFGPRPEYQPDQEPEAPEGRPAPRATGQSSALPPVPEGPAPTDEFDDLFGDGLF